MFLRGSGLSVDEILETSKMTPDLSVEPGKPDSLLVEIKTKEDDPREIAELSTRLKAGGVVGRSKGTHSWNTLSGIIEKSVRQMEAHDPFRSSHHVLWFHCTGIDALVAEERMAATLYGTQTLWSNDVSGLITAYYFHRYAFHRFRDLLDGVVISRGIEAQLHPNPFSSRLTALQGSHFGRVFKSPPVPAERAGERNPMICGAEAPRGNETQMLAHLRAQYQVHHLQIMNMGFQSGWIESSSVTT